MPKAMRKPVPRDIKELCERLRDYFDELTPWLERRQAEIKKLQEHGGILPPPEDPPPKPPDLGV